MQRFNRPNRSATHLDLEVARYHKLILERLVPWRFLSDLPQAVRPSNRRNLHASAESAEDNEPLLDAFGVDAGFNMQASNIQQSCNQRSVPTCRWVRSAAPHPSTVLLHDPARLADSSATGAGRLQGTSRSFILRCEASRAHLLSAALQTSQTRQDGL